MADLFPRSWGGVFARSIMALIAAFATLVLKEYIDTKELDLLPCLLDSAWIAGGMFVLNGLFMLASGRKTANA
jgi:hypothetical protein